MSQSDYSTAIKEAKDSGLVHHDGEWVEKPKNKKKAMAKKIGPYREKSAHDEVGRIIRMEKGVNPTQKSLERHYKKEGRKLNFSRLLRRMHKNIKHA